MRLSISILGMSYGIERAQTILCDGECGNCCPDTLTIQIDPFLPTDRYNKVVFHELIHAMLYEIGQEKAYKNETLVDNLALKREAQYTEDRFAFMRDRQQRHESLAKWSKQQQKRKHAD